MAAEIFNQNGIPTISVENDDSGLIETQTVRYLAGDNSGLVEIAIGLTDAGRSAGATDRLIEAWEAQCKRPGFRNAGRGGREGAIAFMEQVGLYGCLRATNAAS